MGKTMRLSGLLVLGAVFAFANTANANYVVSIVDAGTGANNLTVAPGDSFSLAVDLAGSSTHTAASLTVDFSKAGLTFTGYSWGPDDSVDAITYGTGTPDDKSAPFLTDLPTTIDADSFGNTAGIDVLFDNFLNAGAFSTGRIVTLDLAVPAGWTPNPDQIIIAPGATQSYLDGFFDVTIDGTNDFTLNIVPEPATLALLGIGGLVTVLRRRRTA